MVIECFLGIKHTIKTDKYLRDKIQNIFWKYLNIQHRIFEFKEELRADDIANLYFKTIDNDQNIFLKGRVGKTQAVTSFRKISQWINSRKIWDYINKFYYQNIIVLSQSFLEPDLHKIQIKW